jgi:hypothetical protein
MWPPSGHGDQVVLQRFVGVIHLSRWFLPGIDSTLKPLTDALQGCPELLVMSPEMLAAFSAAGADLIVATPLVHPSAGPDIPSLLTLQILM